MKGKRILTLVISFILCFSISAFAFGCSTGDQGGETSQSSKTSQNDNSDNVADEVDEEKQDWKEDDTLKILTIGNSFSVDTMEHAYEIASSLGIKNIYLGDLFIPNCTLDMHADNAKSNGKEYDYRTNSDGNWNVAKYSRLKDALLAQNWDFISMQQGSGSSGMEDSFSSLEPLINYVTELCPKATLVWHMTWAYQQNSGHREFVKYNKDQMTMYEKIISAVKTQVLVHPEIKIVIPNGTAIQNARTSSVGDTLTRDGHHLSVELGRYIAGLNLIYSLTGLPIDNIEYMPPKNLTAEEKVIAIESVKNSVLHPYEVTESVHK